MFSKAYITRLAAQPRRAYVQNLVNNQNNTSLTRATAGLGADSQYLTMSVWLQSDGGSGFPWPRFIEQGSFEIFRNLTDLTIYLRNSSGTSLYQSPAITLASGALRHLHIKADLGGSPSVVVTIDGADVSGTPAVGPTTGTIDHTPASGGLTILNSSGGSNFINAQKIGDLYIDTTAARDVSLFRTAAGAPVDLTGVGSPAVWLGGSMTASDWNAGTNLGSVGSFTKVGGTFIDA